MIKEKIKCKQGITMVSLVITIVILMIISTTIVYNLSTTNSGVTYNNMVADINILEDKLLVYFNKYGEIPKNSKTINISGVTYYGIDLSKLENVTLNYGKEYNLNELTLDTDAYVVNNNLQVYYLQGTKKAGEIHHEN